MDVDLAIVGAGPAGLTLAWKVAEQGLRVVVIDKKRSTEQVAYLTAGSAINLQAWGLPREIAQVVDTLHFSSKNYSVIQPEHHLSVINRRKLLVFLSERARQGGAQLLFDTRVIQVAVEVRRIHHLVVRSPDGEQRITAPIFADCSGVGRVLERHLAEVPERRVKEGLGIECLVPLLTEPHTIDLYIGSHYAAGYGWLFPLDDHTAIVGYGTFDRAKFSVIRTLLEQMFEFPRVKARVAHEFLEVNGGIFRTGMPLRRFHRGNLVVVGDVALQGNPVVGEGIRFVMDAARMAGEATVHAISERNLAALRTYSTTWVKAYYHQYVAGYLLQRLLSLLTQSDRLCDRAIYRRGPDSQETLSRLIRGEISYGDVWGCCRKL